MRKPKCVKVSLRMYIEEQGIRKRNETLGQHIFKLGVNDDNTDCVNLLLFVLFNGRAGQSHK